MKYRLAQMVVDAQSMFSVEFAEKYGRRHGSKPFGLIPDFERWAMVEDYAKRILKTSSGKI